MGKTLMGSPAKEVGRSNLLTQEQRSYLSQILGMGGQGQQALGGLLQPYSEELFQKSVVDPSMKNFQQQILPSIQQAYGDVGASSSSALNQALSRSATDLASSLAGQRLALQGQQQQANLGGLGALQNALGIRSYQPIIEPGKQGILGQLLAALGQAGGAYLGGL